MSKIKVVQLILPGLLFSLSFFTAATFGQGTGSPSTRYDFDGDRKADISVFRPSNGVWWVKRSSDGTDSATNFGLGPDKIVPADYDGDLKADYAVFRNGTWYRLKTLTSTVDVFNFGLSTDIPLPSDFDGDGMSDISVFRPQNGTWHRLNSSNGQYAGLQWGMTGDIPLVGDYDADGKTDFTVFRPSEGNWYHLNSANYSINVYNFGLLGDIPLAGDFDGDLRFDLAVWRPSSRTWFIKRSSDGGFYASVFGLPTDIPVPADYDGDGKADISVYRPSDSVWHRINSSTNNYVSAQYGIGADIPVPAPNSSTSTPAPPSSFTCDYFASPTGTITGTGTSSSPWDLQTGLGKTTLVRNGKTLCLKGGTYLGKFSSTLNGGGIVRSAPGQWAKIDGYKTTSLIGNISPSQTSFTITDRTGIFTAATDEIVIGGEVIKIFSMSGNTVINCLRAASGSLNGAESHTNGDVVLIGGNQFSVSGSNTTYRDFEVMSSRPGRNGIIENQDHGRGGGVAIYGDSNKLVNLIVHDNVDGIGTSGTSSNTEIYGSLVYNNGVHGGYGGGVPLEEGFGNGMYLENGAGYSRIYDNIVLNSFNLGTQCYGVTAPYVGGDLNGSVWANSGAPLGKFDVNKRNYNLIIGPDSQVSPTAILKNSHFYHSSTTNGYLLKFGYGAGVTTGSITDNYFVGGGTLLEVANTTNATVTGNKLYSSNPFAVYTIAPAGASYGWNNNIYYDGNGRNSYGVPGVGLGVFTLWRSVTGFDANTTATDTRMPDTVVIRPNSYQQGRANAIVYSFSGATTATLNLSTSGLVNGQPYTIRNAQNYYGSPVATGIYNSANPAIVISLTGVAQSVATPIGYDYTPPTTCPQFCPMIVIPN